MNKTTTTETRTPNPGYREHDKVSDWQECDTCGLRIGAGTTTKWDAAYYAGDSSVCPRCAANGKDGLMCLPAAAAIKATEAEMSTIRSQAVNDEARRMMAEGVTLTYEQADELGDGADGWLRGRLGLVADTTDTDVVVYRPKA